jgi:hypothetical protein
LVSGVPFVFSVGASHDSVAVPVVEPEDEPEDEPDEPPLDVDEPPELDEPLEELVEESPEVDVLTDVPVEILVETEPAFCVVWTLEQAPNRTRHAPPAQINIDLVRLSSLRILSKPHLEPTLQDRPSNDGTKR